MLDDEEIKIGQDHDVDSNENYEDNKNDIIAHGKNSVIVPGSHKSSKKEVAIKIIQKKNKSQADIEDIRDCIKMYQIA